MSLLEQWHNERKARHRRMIRAAWKPAPVIIVEPEPEPEPPPLPPPLSPRERLAQAFLSDPRIPRLDVEPAAPVYSSLSDILTAVAVQYAVDRRELVSQRREASIIRPRHVAMYLAKKLTPLSLPAIGRLMGGRDHTTILHAVRKIEAMRAADETLDREINALTAKLVPQE